jgi:hypothetical protein
MVRSVSSERAQSSSGATGSGGESGAHSGFRRHTGFDVRRCRAGAMERCECTRTGSPAARARTGSGDHRTHHGQHGLHSSARWISAALRELTRDCGALLILDEVVTGFRYAPGGCQEYYGVQPDISTFGKALGAGFPVGAVGGPRSILERMQWSENMVLHYGTFNGHRLTMKVVSSQPGSASRPRHLPKASRSG